MFVRRAHHLSMPLFCAIIIFASALGTFSCSSDANAVSSTRILTKSGAPVLISAGSMFGDSEKQTVELVDDVQMTFEGQALRCDRAIMDKKNGRIIAEGNIILASATTYVEGVRADFSYEDNTGIIYDGFVKSGQVLFEGKIIRKVGVDKYEAEQANFTACTTCPPAWSFSGSNIDAEMGAYAYIKSSVMRVGGIPIFWLPYLVVPLKSERQTGVLFPSFEFEGSGIAIGLPYFWAISRSQDFTFTPKYYISTDKERRARGLKFLGNYRYVIDDNSRGELNFGGFFRDEFFRDDINLSPRPGDERAGRWFISHDHMYVLPGGFINRAKIGLVSDLRYTRDFIEDIKGVGDPALENRLSLTKNTESLHSSIEAAYYVNQLKTDPLQGNADSVHRFPEIKQSGVDHNLFDSGVFLRWDFDYVNFAREDLAFDDVYGSDTDKKIDTARGRNTSGTTQPGTGVFQPGLDVIRTGQRLDLRPELSMPLRVGSYFEILPSILLRHTQYSFNVNAPNGTAFDPIPSRQYVRGRLALRTQISRVYDDEPGEKMTADGRLLSADEEKRAPAAEDESSQTGIFQALQPPPSVKRPERLKHEIEPEISVSGIPWIHQTDSPFFGDNASTPIYLDNQPISNSDFLSRRGVQFDYDDRITQRNVISTLITNRFIKKTWNGDQPSYRQIISIKNGTSYEFDKPERGTEANFSDIFTVIDARLQNFNTNTSIRYFPYHRVFNTSSRVQFIDTSGNFIQVSFSQNNLITEKVEEAYANREENLGFAFGLVTRYATVTAALNYTPFNYSPLQADLRLKSWSALANFTPPGNCWGFRGAIERVLSEPDPKFFFSFEYKFGGA